MTETIRSNRYCLCKGCPDRYPACSDHCKKPEYMEYRKEQDRIRKARKKYYTPAWTNAEADQADYRKRIKRR